MPIEILANVTNTTPPPITIWHIPVGDFAAIMSSIVATVALISSALKFRSTYRQTKKSEESKRKSEESKITQEKRKGLGGISRRSCE
jgi:hypothetical protein